MSNRFRKLSALCGATLGFLAAAGIAAANPVITNVQYVSERRIDRFIIEATYKADARSAGGAFRAVSATVTSNNPATTIIDGALSFPDLADGATVTSTDTFVIRHDLRTPFQNSFIGFQVSATPVLSNRTPTANAGPDQTVTPGSTVLLNGSSSTDPDGNPLTFRWTLTAAPAGSAAVILNATSATPSFVATVPGNYVVALVVNDGKVDSAPDSVTVSTINSAPVANAGADRTVVTGASVTLSGSASTDADGNALTYLWRIVSAPPGSHANITNPNAVTPTLVVDTFGTYVLELVVNDGHTNSPPDRITITTGNTRPVANAGPDQTGRVGDTVHLTGAASSDVDGQTLTFAWSIVSAPGGSTSALSSASAVAPTLTITKAGSYVVQLIVNDGIISSLADTMTITTVNTAPIANAGPDQTVAVGATARLNGSASSDVDGNALQFAWSILNRPAGSAATLTSPASATPSFVADVAGQYVVQLIVNDGTVNSPPDTVVVNTGNTPPVANAGTDRTVTSGSLVTLDGSGSSDVDGDALTFSWSFVSRPDGSAAALSNPAAVMPSFLADASGEYVLQLVVNDGKVNSPPDTVIISTTNRAPVANAGADQRVSPGSVVTLNGSASSDPEGDPLTYAWSLLTRPAGSAAVLSSATSTTPTFRADQPGTYVAQLIVNDGQRNSPPDTVTIDTVNVPPVANAGPDQVSAVSATVQLDGSASSDADGQSLTYAWAFTSRPAGSTAALSNPTSVTPTFTVDLPGTYVVQLIVNDGIVNSPPDAVAIRTPNQAPVANAGADKSIDVGEAVQLNGSGSTDADGDPLTYKWSITSAPEGSTATLTGPASATPSFTPDVAGSYTVELVVNDGLLDSAPSSVTVTAGSGEGGTLVNGALHTGSIDTAREVDTWTFTATAGDRIAIHIGEIVDRNDFRPWIRLEGPGGTSVGSSSGTDAAEIGDVLAPATGTYSVRVASADSGQDGTGTYRLTMTHSPGPITVSGDDQGGPLTNGAMQTGEILQGDLDVWTFTATAGERIAVHIGEITDADDFRPWIRVWAPNGATLGSTWGVEAAELGDVIAPMTGTYLVLVASADSGVDGVGTYRLNLAKTPAPSTVSPGDEGGALTNGGVHTGEIVQGDVDIWTFTATAGDRIALHVGEITDTDDFRPWIRLWSPTGATLGNTWNVAAAEIGDVIAPVTGTYLVLVASADSGVDGAGTYRLSLGKTPGPVTVADGDQGGAIGNGTAHTGEILRGDLDVWTFTATAGDRIAVHVGDISETDDFRPWIRLWAPNGATLGNTWNLAAAEIGDVIAPVTGTYLVLVASADSGVDGTGTYRLNVAKTPAPVTASPGDEGGALSNGGVATGEIVRGDVDVWTFTAAAGDRIAVHIGELTDTADFRPWIRLWAPNGATLGNTWNVAAAEIGDVIAPVNGTYLVLVASADSGVDGTGTYRLNIAKTPAPVTVAAGDQGGPLGNGTFHVGEIVRGDVDVWTFDATVGDRIAVHVGELTDADDFRPWIRVWAPNGATLGNTWNVAAAEIGDVIAPVTGTYVVLVASADSGVDGSGTYRLNLAKTPGPIAVTAGDQGGALGNGTAHTGDIVRGDVDVWTFTANAGDRIAVHIGETAETDDFRPWIRLWAPNGATLGNTWNVAAAEIGDVIAPVTGTYLVLVASADSGVDGAGSYRLNLAKTPAPVAVSGGDQGGALTSGVAGSGSIVPGDVDVWTITATAGERITVQITETAQVADFSPWIRLWSPTGGTLGNTWAATTALINGAIAPVSGTYLVLVASADSGVDGAGSYSLTATVAPQ